MTMLSGMKEIRAFCRSINLASSEASVMSMIKTCGFPAKKLLGIWESEQEIIKSWRIKYLTEDIKMEKPIAAAPKKNLSKTQGRNKK